MTERNESRSGSSAVSPAAERAALLALAGLFVITVAWWALALWPPPDVPPAWLLRARAVCFNAGPTGLPDASGWMLLVGQPIGMFAVLMVFAGDAVRSVLRGMQERWLGQSVLIASGVVVALGLSGAVWRVATTRAQDVFVLTSELPAATYPRLDREAPSFELVDQHGEAATLERFAGTPVLMTFAFGHCPDICPMVVHETRRAQTLLRADGIDVTMLVVTLDPWRDTPARLSHLAGQWDLGERGFALSGEVEAVNAMLDGWGVARERDPNTGDIAHPALVFVLDEEGRIAYSANGGARFMVELVGRL